MYRLFISILFLVCSINNSYAQTLWDSVIEVKNVLKQDKDDAAEAMLNRIEKQCMDTGNDSIRVLFMESKGIVLWNKEQYKECIPYFLETIELYDRLHIKAQNYLDAFVAIGYSYGRLKDYNNAERYYRKALLKSVAAQYNKEFRPNVYRNLGNLYKEKGDTLLALECYKRVNGADVEGFDFMNMNDMDWETSCWEMINRLVESKQYEDAANGYTLFIQGLKEKKGNKDKSYLLAVYSRAILLSRYLDKVNDAIPLYSELVSLSETLSEPDENICGAFCNLALCYSQTGEYDKLNTVVTKGFSYLGKANMNGYPPHMIYRFSGNGAYWQKDYTKAIDYYELYLKPSNKREEGTNYEEIVNQLSVSYIFSNQPDKAQTILKNLLKSDKARLNKDNPSLLATVYHNLGRATMLVGSKSEALKYLSTSKEMQVSLYGEVSERTAQYITECSTK